MEISKVAQMAAITPQSAAKSAVQTAADKSTSTLASDNSDKFVKSDYAFMPAYTKKSAQKGEAEMHPAGLEVDNSEKGKSERMVEFVTSIISRQANKKKELRISLPGIKDESHTKDELDVQSVATRILEFALSLTAGDTSLFKMLKEAFVTGFSHAEGLHGGAESLPKECYDVFGRVSVTFDYWEEIRKQNG